MDTVKEYMIFTLEKIEKFMRGACGSYQTLCGVHVKFDRFETPAGSYLYGVDLESEGKDSRTRVIAVNMFVYLLADGRYYIVPKEEFYEIYDNSDIEHTVAYLELKELG